MRTPIGLAFAIAIAANATDLPPRERIDLDVPGNLEALARTHPDHFEKIRQILAEVPRRPPRADSVAIWMRSNFQARDIQYADVIMTSYPPKKRLEFSLDKTSYVKVITLDLDASLQPLKKAPER